MRVSYPAFNSVVIDAAGSLATPVTVRFLSQEPDAVLAVSVGGESAGTVTADAEGNADVTVPGGSAWPVAVECAGCAAPHAVAGGGESFVTAVSVGGVATRNNSTDRYGMKITVGTRPITVTSLGRYRFDGDQRVHRVRLQSEAGVILGTASVDLAAGEPDANGFVYGTLAEPVMLEAGATYYVTSLETSGQDKWADQAATVQTTAVASVVGAAAGQRPAASASADHTYGPVNFLYQLEPTDTAKLDEAIAEAEDLTEGDYTPVSWAALQSALSAARVVSGDDAATQDDVDDAVLALRSAIGGLERVPAGPSGPAVSPSVAFKCAAGRVYLAVTVVNDEDVEPVSLVLSGPFGSKSFASVAAGRKATASFNTLTASLTQGGALALTAGVAGVEPVVSDVVYGAYSCGG
jgi:hypothetical protein